MAKINIKCLYLVNKLDTHVVAKGGYITVPRGGYATISESDLEHPDVQDAVMKNWVEVWDQVPGASDLKNVPSEIEIAEPYKGMTAEELKVSNEDAKNKAQDPKEEAVTQEPAGKPPTKKKADKTTDEKTA